MLLGGECRSYLWVGAWLGSGAAHYRRLCIVCGACEGASALASQECVHKRKGLEIFGGQQQSAGGSTGDPGFFLIRGKADQDRSFEHARATFRWRLRA